MNRNCDVVRDILPLYAEDLASPGSCALIEEHLETCEGCRGELMKINESQPILAQTDTGELLRLRRGLRRRTVFSILLAVCLTLTVFAGMLVYAVIPVWVPVEEAIIAVDVMEDGRIRVEAADCVSGIFNYNNSFCFQRMRLDLFYNDSFKQMREQKGHYFYFQLEEGESLWYSGWQTYREDSLVWGDGDTLVEMEVEKHTNKTLLHVFCVTVFAAAVLFLVGLLLKKNLFGKLCLMTGSLAFFCTLSCLFVTDGYLLVNAMVRASFQYNRLSQQLLAIVMMAVLSYLSVLVGWQTVKAYKE